MRSTFPLNRLLIVIAIVAALVATLHNVWLSHRRQTEVGRIRELIDAAATVGGCGATVDYEPPAYVPFYMGALAIQGGTLTAEAARALCDAPVSELVFAGTNIPPDAEQVLLSRFSTYPWPRSFDEQAFPTPPTVYLRN